jgi:hypothetical protein
MTIALNQCKLVFLILKGSAFSTLRDRLVAVIQPK